ncbi:hypothetical protein [Prevotella koreensis]|uniref:Glycosyltransferase family 1 protein n=1 Tax=Prevotella koreensis TaxID=2490854 RepID=A0A3S0PUK7_9BACT|nr:hypothetical protein [Prevotella koreensis]RUL59374.1 hypothetical protein EHV08_06125 [Prevotella koreensis]
MKKVVAVAPYNHGVNFKMQVYDAWVKMGGETMPSHYPWRLFHRFAYNYELPTIPKNNDIAQLRFVEPVSLSFDTFPDYARYEIIPLVWDCWPIFFEKTCRWFVKHDVKTAIFTSSQTAERMRERFPNMNIMTITEGIDTSLYKPGKELKYRKIDLLEFGRNNGYLFKKPLPSRFNHIYSKGGRLFVNNADFYNALQDTKITICVPRCDVQPEVTGGIETLTQRYWENMLSRIIMIGRAPKELTELIGYNPVVDLNKENIYGQILDVFENIEEYQNLVNKNFDTAMKKGNWRERIIQIQKFLYNLEYK